jgi:integrase
MFIQTISVRRTSTSGGSGIDLFKLPMNYCHNGKLVNAIFYRWRHTGASELAATGADPVMITRMMGDVSLTTVMEHYFDSSLEHMQEFVENWDQRGMATASVIN